VEYVIRVVAAELEPGDAKGKSTAAAQVLPLINDIADPVERDHYLGVLSRTLGVNEAALRQAAEKRGRAGGQGSGGAGEKERRRPTTDHRPLTTDHRSPPEPETPPDDFGPPARGVLSGSGGKIATRQLRRTGRLEENFLRQCLEHPGAINHVNRLLRHNKQPEVSADDFVRVEDKAILAVIEARATQPAVATIAELCDSLDSVLAQRVKALLGSSPKPGMKLDRLPDSLALSVLDWRLEKIREHIAILKQLFPNASQKDLEDELNPYYFEREIKEINRARDAMSATGRRRAEEKKIRN
jgi:DNA primase